MQFPPWPVLQCIIDFLVTPFHKNMAVEEDFEVLKRKRISIVLYDCCELVYLELTFLEVIEKLKSFVCCGIINRLNNCRYAYETGEDEEEGISLTGAGVVVGGELASKVERKERKASIASDHVFGLGEDLEEDKRE